MDIDHWIKMLEVMVQMLQVLIWPALALVGLLYLGKTLKNYLIDLGRDKNVSEVSAEAGTTGLKVTIKRQVEAAAMLMHADELSKPAQSPTDQQTLRVDKAQEIVNLVMNVATPQAVQKVAGAKVLWVDDHPSNNIYPRKALEALGIHFTLSTSTNDALERIRLDPYDVIISDMNRPPDKQAGLTLLEALRKQQMTTAFIIFARADRSDLKAEIKRRGGYGVALSYQELFQFVIDVIQKA
jgi:CheY-like chemotaxis protein